MALKIAPRVKETTSTTGTGTLNLNGASTGFQSFVAGIGSGNTCPYYITDGIDWEEGIGMVTAGAPDTLSRDVVIASSKADAKVNWAAGTRDVRLGHPTGLDRVHEAFGHLGGRLLTKTAGYTVTTDDRGALIDGDTSAGAFTITLPAAATAKANFIAGIRKTTADANALTIDGNGTETINGSLTFVLANQNAYVWLVCDGTNWQIIGQLGGQGTNALINGGFDIWQRGTSFNPPGGGTTADMWANWQGSGGTPAATISQQAHTLGQIDVPGEPEFFLRHDQTAAATTGVPWLRQRIEGVRTLAGRTATISLWAKVASGTLAVTPRAIQHFGTGGTPSADVSTVLTQQTITTGWQRFSLTIAVPSISGKTIGTNGDDYLEILFEFPLNATFTLDISNAQIEVGSVATPFEARPYAEELLRAFRYLWVIGPGLGSGNRLGVGQANGTTVAIALLKYPVKMRSVPSLTVSAAGDFSVGDANLNGLTLTGLVFQNGTIWNASLNLTVASGLVAGNAAVLLVGNANAKLTFSAEL